MPPSAAVAAFQQAFVGMAVLATDGTWLHVNDALCLTLGCTARELMATSYQALIPAAGRAADMQRFTDLCEGRAGGYQVEQQLITKAGAPRWVRSSLSLALGTDRHLLGVIILVEDVDGRRDLEATASTSLGELQRSNTELQAFASVAAHDLQEPLRKIRTFSDRLQVKFADSLGESGTDYLQRIQASAERMQNLIDDLLAYARVSIRAQPFAVVDLGIIAREVVTDLEARLEQSGGRIEIGDLPTIEADATQMRQLFQNLLGNSLKFAMPGLPPIVTIATEKPLRPGTVTISVRDNGIGFDTAYANRVFEPFERLHGRSEYDGTGIGLAICRRIVDRHGGTITADANPGNGALFAFTLPAAQGETAP
ncbi:MAG: ATP-binding protein [Chloroflexota bacterium]